MEEKRSIREKLENRALTVTHGPVRGVGFTTPFQSSTPLRLAGEEYDAPRFCDPEPLEAEGVCKIVATPARFNAVNNLDGNADPFSGGWCARKVGPLDPFYRLQAEASLLSRRWRARMNERLESLGLTQARSTVLFALSQHPEGLSQRELADRAGIESPTLVRQLDALEAQGLVRRVASLHDRRVNRIELTETAGPTLDQIRAVFRSVHAEFLQAFDPTEIMGCTATLSAVRARLDEEPSPGADRRAA